MNSSGTGDSVAPGGAELVIVGGMHVKEVGKSGIECWKCGLSGESLVEGSQTVLGFIAWRAVTLEAQQGPVDDYIHPCQNVLMKTQDFVSEVSRTSHETHQIITKPMGPVLNQYALQ